MLLRDDGGGAVMGGNLLPHSRQRRSELRSRAGSRAALGDDEGGRDARLEEPVRELAD